VLTDAVADALTDAVADALTAVPGTCEIVVTETLISFTPLVHVRRVPAATAFAVTPSFPPPKSIIVAVTEGLDGLVGGINVDVHASPPPISRSEISLNVP